MVERVKLYKLYQRGKTWWAYFSIPTKQGNNRFRCSTFTSDKKQAELFCTNKIVEIQKREAKGNRLSVDEAFGLFYQRHGQYFARPTETLKKLGIIKSNLDVVMLDDLNSAALSLYIENRRKSVSNSTINRELVILSSVLTKCKIWGYKTADVQPCKFKLKEPAENIKYLDSWETAEKIIAEAPSHLKPIIYTALYTGMRRGNILALKWDNLDFNNNLINVRVKDRMKDGGKNLSIPMIDKLKTILQAQPKINEYVFNYNGSPITDIKHSWRTTLKNAGLPYTNFHTLRHTAATWILKKTGNLKLTQQILGHASIQTTLKYAHVLDAEKRAALEDVFN